MTPEEVQRLAQRVGFPIQHPEWRCAVEEFAALVAAAEREACAKLCEAQEYEYWRSTVDQDFTPQDCAAAIRARATQHSPDLLDKGGA